MSSSVSALYCKNGHLVHRDLATVFAAYNWPAWDTNWTISDYSPDELTAGYAPRQFQGAFGHYLSAHAMMKPAAEAWAGSAISEGSSAYFGLIHAPPQGAAAHGCLYAIPFNATRVMKYDPNTDTTSYVGSVGAVTGKWVGGALGSDGCIYGIPYNATSVLKIDPSTDTVSTFGSLSGTAQWYGGAMGHDGTIYGAPYNSNNILCINTTAETTSTIATGRTATGKFAGAVLSFNDYIRFISHQESILLNLKLSDSTLSTGALPSLGISGGKWIGGCVLPNGEMMIFPWNDTECRIITQNGSVWGSYYATITTSQSWGGVISSSGWVLPSLYSETEWEAITAAELSRHPVWGLGSAWGACGSCLCSDGRIYLLPNTAGQKLYAFRVSGTALPEDLVLSRFLNKQP